MIFFIQFILRKIVKQIGNDFIFSWFHSSLHYNKTQNGTMIAPHTKIYCFYVYLIPIISRHQNQTQEQKL